MVSIFFANTVRAKARQNFAMTSIILASPRHDCETVVVVVAVDSHIQRIVLATEETTMTQQVSHRPIKYQSRLWSQRGLRRPTGRTMVTTRYSDQQGSKSRQKDMLLYK